MTEDTRRETAGGRKVWFWDLGPAEQLPLWTAARNWMALAAAIVAALTFVIGYRQTELQRIVSGDKDRELKSFQTNADQKTAELSLKAAEAEKTMEETRRQNLILERSVEQEKAARLRLEDRMSPRRMSTLELNRMVAALNELPPNISFSINHVGTPESAQFAEQVATAFRAAGRPVEGLGQAFFTGGAARGIILSGPHALQFKRVFDAVNIASQIIDGDTENRITVADKPEYQ